MNNPFQDELIILQHEMSDEKPPRSSLINDKQS